MSSTIHMACYDCNQEWSTTLRVVRVTMTPSMLFTCKCGKPGVQKRMREQQLRELDERAALEQERYERIGGQEWNDNIHNDHVQDYDS